MDWVFEYDYEKTKNLYYQIPHGSSFDCNCEECTNFRLIRDSIYPDELLQLLHILGIDSRKEIENYCLDPSLESHLSSVWFHFVGRIISIGSLGDLNAGQYRREDLIMLNSSTYLAINAEPSLLLE